MSESISAAVLAETAKTTPGITYVGIRSHGDVIVNVNGQPLDPRFDLRNHSPNGFEWGYRGSGPAQLALAILDHHLGDDERAVLAHQDFKREVVAGLEYAGWTLSDSEIAMALEAIEGRAGSQ